MWGIQKAIQLEYSFQTEPEDMATLV